MVLRILFQRSQYDWETQSTMKNNSRIVLTSEYSIKVTQNMEDITYTLVSININERNKMNTNPY